MGLVFGLGCGTGRLGYFKMLHIVLYQPEIPPNTGNIMRLCANAGFYLHLIKPLGFSLSEKNLKRASLDYVIPHDMKIYESFKDFQDSLDPKAQVFLCSTKAKTLYTEAQYQPNTYLVFGPETRGLPAEILAQYLDDHKIMIPMQPNSRSLNLSNAVAITAYEAWRQLKFGIIKGTNQ